MIIYFWNKRGNINIFILTLTGTDQHRLNPTLIASILSALRQANWVRAKGRAKTMERFLQLMDQLKQVVGELISLPMPTIAAVQGHSVAAGAVLALSHDYVLVRSDRGVIYMSELDLGVVLPGLGALFPDKVGSVMGRREMLLRGTKLKGEEAVRLGIVDSAYGSEGELSEAAMRLGEELAKRKWEGEAYREIRKSLYPELCEALGLDTVKQAKSQATPGSVLITTSQGNCFSSGIDIAWVRAEGKRPASERLVHLLRLLKPVVAELISLPMPTIAAVQGHSVGAGMVLALSHDYVLVRSDSGVMMYMSELDLGFPMPEYFSVLFRAKLRSVAARREMLLRRTKLKVEEAVRMFIVDSAYGSEGELREAAMRLGEELAKRKWEGEAYREIRKSQPR
ncbi:hypothetical protein Tsubulata_038173 [Turnera subulata]|uniref:Uncharacterized protein n=1 Tax=Turnera subulata TaxID=218843 RepID=A0A9Q0JNN5_9ROSI|nr:hypothetical protein Tsubulata_038173 [Turnera subulata]